MERFTGSFTQQEPIPEEGIEAAVAVLRRFIKREELGPVIQVNISDFSSGISVLTSVAAVQAAASAMDLGFTETNARKPLCP